MATVRCEILDANMLPPTTANDVQTVCPNVAPMQTPNAFLCVAQLCHHKHKFQWSIKMLQIKTQDQKSTKVIEL